MMKKEQGKNDREGNPYGELLVDGHVGEDVEQKKSGDGDRYGRGVVDIDGADKITLFPFQCQTAMGAFRIHAKRFCIQPPDAAARASQTQAVAEYPKRFGRHLYALTSSSAGAEILLFSAGPPFRYSRKKRAV